MDQRMIIDYKNYCILDCLIRKMRIPYFIFDDELSYVRTFSFFQRVKWIDQDNKVTNKGKRAHERLAGELALRGIYRHVYPDFSQVASQGSNNHIYLP
ncbi:hypothetical protein [Levilactobacillus parabrevis]|uniref:hypothetical protein n=1 Tax=Levilactobacillus parabrevis TaxID=357278 RepID=UPI00375736EA